LGVGDLATAVPALRALRTAHPDQQLALIAPAWLTPLVNLIGGIDRLVDAPGLGPLEWTGPAPDLAVNLHGRGPQSHRMLTTTRPRRLLAFANHEAGHHDGPAWRADEHEVDRWCRLLAWYGIPADRTDLALRRPAPGDLPTGVTILHPGAKAPQRRWPPERFAAVARHLTTAGHHIMITGNHSERPLAHHIAHLAGLPTHTVLAGHTDLHHLATLTAHARLLISGDTGIAHLATAYHTPSVLLFGPASPAHWGPPPDRPRHQVLWTGPYRGAHADAVPHPALAALDVPDVLAAVDRVDRAARAADAVPGPRDQWTRDVSPVG
ncbi:glycosyltransferase family 9 protein, partial [Micromonospora sp. BQ11]|uniref:glycosyltransferase family 9 protein n=1 Tax=Micromonospora sp. BQ11 TaxID=3452212 RepID=UPI003F8C29DF